MKRKILASILSLTLIATSSSGVFAADEIYGQQIIAEHQAAIVEEVVGTEDVCTDIEESKRDFTIEGESLELKIPKDGDDEIIMASEDGAEISMGLPKEAEKSEAVLTDDGTVVYNTSEDVSVAVQAMQETQGNLVLEGVRSMVIIENADAPKEYSFNYDLPKGYELVRSEEYYADEEDVESGWVYIVDTKNVLVDQKTGEEFTDIVTVIEPAWATDANGNDINTYYKVEGSELIQIVEFNEESAFPIVADPKATSRPKNILLTSGYDTITINNSDVSATITLAGVATDISKKGFKKAFEKRAREELKKKLKKQLAKKSVKYASKLVTAVMTVIDVYCAWQWLAKGYTYTNFDYRYEEWKVYKHQGGKWVGGYANKAWVVDVWGR